MAIILDISAATTSARLTSRTPCSPVLFLDGSFPLSEPQVLGFCNTWTGEFCLYFVYILQAISSTP